MRKLLTGVSILLCSLPISTLTFAEAPQGLPAEVVHAKREVLPSYIEAVGTLKANESVILRPEVTGRIDRIAFAEGDEVKKGTSLIHLDDSIYRAQVAEAKARVQLSEAEYRRVNKLFKNGATSETDRDSALAQMRINEAQLDQAKVTLDKMEIRAPFDGIVGLRQFSPGDYVTAGTNMLEIVDVSSMKLDFRIPEIYLPEVEKGQPLEITLSAFPGKTFSGEVVAISPQISEQGRNILIRALLPNPGKELRPGLFAKVQLLVKEESTIMIPEQALIPQGNSSMVYQYVDNKIAPVPVQLGKRLGAKVAIYGGVKEGDVIVTAGQLKLQPGAPITPIFVDQQPQGEVSAESATEDAAPAAAQ